MIETTTYPGIFSTWKGKRKLMLTENLTPGRIFFRELLWSENDKEYRVFDPRHSKIAAGLAKRMRFFSLKKNDAVLYLGASHGYTASFISDLVGKNGVVYCVDIAPRVVRDLYFVCEQRENMQPLLADANKPEAYTARITPVDVIIQDVAHRMQVQILLRNMRFLKAKGIVYFSVKARSIDSTKKPMQVFRDVEEELKRSLKILEKVDLSPFERDHMLFVCQKK
ncbi:fibrillarin-like rRNA/tRNA 2'-O-methyltransferase [Candidatus Woesearchaeota archaeon]|nr:fibrillarin-like rRNA/tRNA 2'-O-methyltransferase [Candidatus Woesearchaeota archaeon]